MLYFLVFISTLLTNVAWANYTLAVAKKRPLPAGAWAAVTFLCAAFNVVTYVNNHWALVPAALGAFAGTWWAVRREK